LTEFSDFSIQYLGTEDRTPVGTSASLYVESYKVSGKNNNLSQMIEVHSGQLPAKNVDFVVGKNKFTLLTYSKNGKALYPLHFVIEQH
jgi:hypothetical protein